MKAGTFGYAWIITVVVYSMDTQTIDTLCVTCSVREDET